MDARTNPPVRALIVDVAVEAKHWKSAWRSLPKATVLRSFKRYWPLIQAGYDVYLACPHDAEQDNLQRYLARGPVVGSPLGKREAELVFRRV